MTRSPVPPLSSPRPFLPDGGLETDHGIYLPPFASFVLLDTADGRDATTEAVRTQPVIR